LIYFRDGSNPDRVGASYVVILPVSVDISKYVPPFLAGQVEQMGSGDMSSFAFPPAPELVPSEAWLRKTAENRGDDLLFGGAVNLNDVTSLMEVVAGISAEYAEQYDSSAGVVRDGGSGAVGSESEPAGAICGCSRCERRDVRHDVGA
jgi:hypothetical protein